MFGSLGVPELIFIFGLALLIFGPRKLPEIGRTIGRGLAEFRKASTDLKRSINTEMIEEEMRKSDPRSALHDDPAKESSEAKSDGDAEAKSPAAGETPEVAPPEGSVPRSPVDATTASETPADGKLASETPVREVSDSPSSGGASRSSSSGTTSTDSDAP